MLLTLFGERGAGVGGMGGGWGLSCWEAADRKPLSPGTLLMTKGRHIDPTTAEENVTNILTITLGDILMGILEGMVT